MKNSTELHLFIAAGIWLLFSLGFIFWMLTSARAELVDTSPTQKQSTLDREEFIPQEESKEIPLVEEFLPVAAAVSPYEISAGLPVASTDESIVTQDEPQQTYFSPSSAGDESFRNPDLSKAKKSFSSKCGKEVVGTLPDNVPCECIRENGLLEYQQICDDKTYTSSMIPDENGIYDERMITYTHNAEWDTQCEYLNEADYKRLLEQSKNCTYKCIDRSTIPPATSVAF
jgi:hypothetical protein